MEYRGALKLRKGRMRRSKDLRCKGFHCLITYAVNYYCKQQQSHDPGPCTKRRSLFVGNEYQKRKVKPNKIAGNSEAPFWFNSEEAALAWLYFRIRSLVPSITLFLEKAIFWFDFEPYMDYAAVDAGIQKAKTEQGEDGG